MADAVTTTTVIDGARTAVIYCTNTSDNSGEAAVTKVDVSALSSRQDGTACTGVRLEKIVFSNVGMGGKILILADFLMLLLLQGKLGIYSLQQ